MTWFVRVLAAFVRRELVAMSGYRAAFATRLAGFAFVVVGLVFFARFVGASANPHMAVYGGNYLGFVAIGFLATELQQVGIAGLARRVRTSQIMGTLEAEVATPAPAWMVLGGAPVYEFGTAALRSALYLWAATVFSASSCRARTCSRSSSPCRSSSRRSSGSACSRRAARCSFAAQPRGGHPRVPVVLRVGRRLSRERPAGLASRAGSVLPLTHVLVVLRGAFLVGAPPRR